MECLSDDQLTYTPREGLRPLGEIFCHIASNEEGWFRYCVTHQIDGWDEADFRLEDYPSIPAIRLLLAEVHERTLTLLTHDTQLVLKQEITLPWGPVISVEGVVWHVLEHEIHHRGEIYLMLGLLGIEAPDV